MRKFLISWKTDPLRKPLIIRGARQVGKTWLIDSFGKESFINFVKVNFELQTSLKSLFNNLETESIITGLELSLNVRIIPGETLLFFDEIQECPAALKSLRYFYEQLPALHVIAAGSLLEFIHESENISIPVGRVSSYFLQPLSFGEFLNAAGEDKLRSFLSSLQLDTNIPDAVHQKCLTLLKAYFFTGGMPAAADFWCENRKFTRIPEIHLTLLQNYRQDFGKYGKKINHEYLEAVFNHVSASVGTKFKYVNIDPHAASRELKKALLLLVKAQVLSIVRATSGTGLPLRAHIHERMFKVLFLDIGLFQTDRGLSEKTILSENILGEHLGASAEQYAGQQLLSLNPCFAEPELFYWQREEKGSEAEVDYLYQHSGQVFPIEVKHGSTGTLRSLRLFLTEKHVPFGIRVSRHPLSVQDRILSVPLYAMEALPSLVQQYAQG